MQRSIPEGAIIEEEDLTIGGEIGGGAYGVAFKAILRGAVPVCVKGLRVLLDPLFWNAPAGSKEQENALRELVDEFSTLMKLRHPNIMHLHGLCLEKFTRLPKYLVLELANDSLGGYLAKSKAPLTLPLFLQFWRDLIAGLVFMHAAGAIHRDLKPDNILVFLNVDTVVLKVCDVGLARFTTSSGQLRNTVGGSAFYSAPDIYLGPFDARADVFSFGVMMAEIVVCHLTVPGHDLVSNVAAVYGSGIEGRFPMIEDAVVRLRQLSPALAALLAACCQKKAKHRKTSAETQLGLDAALTSEPGCDALTISDRDSFESLPFKFAAPVAAVSTPDWETTDKSSISFNGSELDTVDVIVAMADVGLKSIVRKIGGALLARDSISLDELLCNISFAKIDPLLQDRLRHMLTTKSGREAAHWPKHQPHHVGFTQSETGIESCVSESGHFNPSAFAKSCETSTDLSIAAPQYPGHPVFASHREDSARMFSAFIQQSVEPEESAHQVCLEAFKRASMFPHSVSAGEFKDFTDTVSPYIGIKNVAYAYCKHVTKLCEASRPDTNRTNAGSMGVISVTIAALLFHIQSRKIQEAGCLALRNLVAGNNTNKTALMISNNFHCVLRAMEKFPASPVLSERACAIIRSLATGSAEAKAALASAGTLVRLCDVMDCHLLAPAVQVEACWALKNLAANSPGNQAAILEADGLYRIYAAMAAHPESAPVQHQGCGALNNMCSNEVACSVIRSGRGLMLVRKAVELHSANSEIVKVVGSLLTKLK